MERSCTNNGRSAPYRKALDATRENADRSEHDIGPPDDRTSVRAMLFGIRQAKTRGAVNNLERMFRLALASHVEEVWLSDIRPLVGEYETRFKLLATRHQTGDDIHTRGRTTRRTARLEMALSEHLSLSLTGARLIVLADNKQTGAIEHARKHTITGLVPPRFSRPVDLRGRKHPLRICCHQVFPPGA